MQEFFLQYCLTKKLATKTLRITYLAYPLREAQKQVIIKIFAKECINLDQGQNLFLLNTLKSLDHPNIIPVLDIAVGQDQPYVVNEYRAHGSLRQRLEHLEHEHMDWPEAMSIVLQIGRALSYAHSQGLIHGNIKPENIFYHHNGEVQLTDFNLSPFIDLSKLGYKGDLRTTRYMAPEQFMGQTSKASDQYALACLAYELITGHVPFDAQSFSSMWGKHTTNYAVPLTTHVPKVPMPIDLAILRALSKTGTDRYEDMDAFLLALENGLAVPTSDTAPTSPLRESSLSMTNTAKEAPETKPLEFTTFPKTVADTETVANVAQPSTYEVSEDIDMQAITVSLTPLAVQHKRKKSSIFWISTISVALILLGCLIPYLLNVVPSHQVAGKSPLSNTVDTTITALATVGAKTTDSAVKPTRSPSTASKQEPTLSSSPIIVSSTQPGVTPTALAPVIAPAQQGSPTAAVHTVLPTPIPTPIPTPTPTPILHGVGSIKINAGGGASGSFVADTDFNGGLSVASNSPIDTSGVSNPAPENVYQSNRYGNLSYTIPNLTPNASYTVRLHFAETYWTQVGMRTFNVILNGQQVLSDFDIIAAAGSPDKAVVEQFVTTPNSDNAITIQFVGIQDNAQINGIEILAN